MRGDKNEMKQRNERNCVSLLQLSYKQNINKKDSGGERKENNANASFLIIIARHFSSVYVHDTDLSMPFSSFSRKKFSFADNLWSTRALRNHKYDWNLKKEEKKKFSADKNRHGKSSHNYFFFRSFVLVDTKEKSLKKKESLIVENFFCIFWFSFITFLCVATEGKFPMRRIAEGRVGEGGSLNL